MSEDKEQGSSLLTDLEAERYRTILTTEARTESIEYSIAGAVLGAAEQSSFIPDGADFEVRCNQRNEFAGRVIEILSRYAERRGFRADLAQPVVDPQRIAEIRRWSRIQADMEAAAERNRISPGESKNERRLREWIDYLLSCIQPAGELTVEQALSELREMFPNASVKISARAFGVDNRHELGYWTVEIDNHTEAAASLSDCMSQVRAWAKSQTVEKTRS